MSFKQWLATLNPMYDVRQKRLALFNAITLPVCNIKSHKLDKRVSLHPLLDQYLTIDERVNLMLKYGWLRVNPYTDKHYVVDYQLQCKMIDEHIKQSDWKWMLTDDITTYKCCI